jgi:large subunit ribosomal protein L9e
MKYTLTENEVEIPEGVTFSVKNREVTIGGPLGTLKKSFKHVSLDITKG